MNKIEFQQEISKASKPIIVDFWAAWCGPCMNSKPILEKLAEEYAGKVEFVPVDADDSRDVLEQFRVFGIPTLLMFHGGKEVSRATGSLSEANYRAMFEALAKGKEVKIPLAQFERILRLGTGALFFMIGISSGSWLVAGVGGIIAFMGIYDRCPIWRALTGTLKRN